MNFNQININHRSVFQHFLAITVILQVAMYITLFLNIPLARTVIGIVYLTFIPGLIFVKLLKLNDLGTSETIVYAVGFSLAFLMLAGLLIDAFGPALGLSFPLSTLPLSLFINSTIIVGAAVAHLRQGKIKPSTGQPKSGFNPFLLLLTLLPLLSIIGTYAVNTTGNNIYLLIMIAAIAALITVTAFFDRSPRFYALAIVMIALALLFQTSLISNYVIAYGGDSPAEFFVFQHTQANATWNPVFTFADQNLGRFNAMLSITILPTVYSNMLGLDPTWVFKIIYSLIFSIVPLALYLLWQPYIGKRFAFFAAFLFMAQSTFYTEMVALNRQMVAELFFVLMLLLLLNKKIKMEAKFAGFAILGFGLIFSHYALAEIFLFFIFAAWAASVFYVRKPSFNLKLSMIVFFFVIMFAWYIYTSGAVVFDSFITFTQYVASQLGDFFNPASRGQTVLTGLGLVQAPSILSTVSRGFAYLTELFIALGVVALIRKKPNISFERDYTVFSLLAVIFLGILTVVPGLANTLSMTRFYHILLMFLAPFCIIGIAALSQFLFKKEKKLVVALIIVAVLVPYFLFQTNFIYEVAGAQSWSISLSENSMSQLQLYGSYGFIDSYSVHGAQWVSKYVPYQYNLAGDNGLYTSLMAYGLVYRGYVTPLTNNTVLNDGEFVYLSYISIHVSQQNDTSLQKLNQTSVVYSNGGSEVRFNP